MIRGIFLFAAVYVALIGQEFLPPVDFLGGAHLLLVPVLFCYGALWLTFPAMIALALYTGLLSDLAFLHVVGDSVEIGLGWSILFYLAAGTALQPFRPLFLSGRWEIHCLASGAVTFVLLLLQYAMICLRRGSFLLDWTVFWQIAGPAIMALMLAPAVYFIFRILPANEPSRPRGKGLAL